MHGHGYAPPPPRRPSTGVLVVLRVIFVAMPLLSIGFLAWTAPLRAAIATRRKRDWWVFMGSIAITAFVFFLLASDTTDDFSSPNGEMGMILLLLHAVACVSWFLYVDIRHFDQPHFRSYIPPGHPTAGYGYQQAPPPYGVTHPGTPVPQPPASQQPPVPSAPPQPQRPAPARIDQVRAELDELSDYLRKHEDDR
ncbi:hypothetical protein G5C60_36275 [Streptomyces sp. HC44]|uniref:Integral membrane protein n=1 Tax=Streptomyces scabichelini TaxID=2711217 RepID=A0A6G4VG19_9ACTN|nr:hypothetical protein [Streptomyces scabichelini]NGO12911.1 hypothetical protein [Streptomyces scabichelini]